MNQARGQAGKAASPGFDPPVAHEASTRLVQRAPQGGTQLMSSTVTTTAPAIRTRVIEVPVRTCACSTIKAQVSEPDALPKRVRRYVAKDGTLATECDAETLSRWAPGHDARAVSILAALKRAGIEAAYDESAISPALQEKIDYVPVAKEKPLVAARLADGTEIEGRVGRDGKIRTESGDVHNAGTFLLI